LAAGAALSPFVANTVVYLHRALQSGREILFEGAQGTFLDIDHGTYPYVTSSNTTAGGACTGSGVPPHRMDRVVGVMKAYTTRVGEGPLPTEDASFAKRLHEMGREFGATTGRARRCGWFDAVATHYATMINGIDELAITNLDGLDGVNPISICVGYRLNGKRLDVPPCDSAQWNNCEPIYESMPGWSEPTRKTSPRRPGSRSPATSEGLRGPTTRSADGPCGSSAIGLSITSGPAGGARPIRPTCSGCWIGPMRTTPGR